MKILELVQNYPSKTSHNRMYIHVRNKYYIQNDIDVTVLNFSAKENYTYDGINVITLDYYKKNKESYNILCMHAPNIKNHYRFLNKYNKLFNKIVFFFHGQEILKWNKDYPKEYSFKKKSIISKLFRNIYDYIKIILWKNKIKKLINKSHLVFVSNYLFNKFKNYSKIDMNIIKDHYSIINNSVGELFELNNYDKKTNKEYDFITIRGEALDESKYGIDIVTRLAFNNPKFKFLVIGKGNYYKYNKKPENIEFINDILTHEEIIKYVNKSKYALMPTKHDTQGVLTSELITFSIPTITSNLDVCIEMFNDFDNVVLIDNYKDNDLDKIISKFSLGFKKNTKFYRINTMQKEIDLFKEL